MGADEFLSSHESKFHLWNHKRSICSSLFITSAYIWISTCKIFCDMCSLVFQKLMKGILILEMINETFIYVFLKTLPAHEFQTCLKSFDMSRCIFWKLFSRSSINEFSKFPPGLDFVRVNFHAHSFQVQFGNQMKTKLVLFYYDQYIYFKLRLGVLRSCSGWNAKHCKFQIKLIAQ